MPTIQLPADMPTTMKLLPRDDVGRPVPFFVQWIDGKPDFRVMNETNYRTAIKRRLCWVCGHKLPSSQERLGKVEVMSAEPHTFVAGPMCLVNRVSAEPPAHPGCAMWSARACPFLSNPSKGRRETGLPDNTGVIGGEAIMRNPGVTGLFAVKRWWVERVPNGQLIRFSNIVGAQWFCEGRTATRAEVQDSLDTGLPRIQAVAESEGPEAVAQLHAAVANSIQWLP